MGTEITIVPGEGGSRTERGDENNVGIKSRPSSPHAKPSAIRSAGAAKSQLMRPKDDRRMPEETHTRWQSAKMHGAC